MTQSKAEQARHLRENYPELTAAQIQERLGMTRSAFESAMRAPRLAATRETIKRRLAVRAGQRLKDGEV